MKSVTLQSAKIQRLKSMTNDPTYFNKLDFYALKRIAYSWGQRYPVIERVTLFPGVYPRYDYVLVAEARKVEDGIYEQFKNDWNSYGCSYLRHSLESIYKDNRRRKPCAGIVEELMNRRQESPRWLFLKKQPSQGIESLEHWSKERLRRFVMPDYYWVLYQKEKDSSGGNELTDLIRKAAPELESLHAAVKKGGYNIPEPNPEERYKERALKKFQEKGRSFIFVKKQYLEDKNVYLFGGGQEKRDFIGKVLQKIVEDYGLPRRGYQTLYQFYLKAK